MRTPLPHDESVRHRLHGESDSSARRYASFVIGDVAWPRLVGYELVTTLLGPIPGALGLLLRKLFYPLLFERIGRDVTFGRNVVVRHSRRIRLGDGVFLDDGCLLDGRGVAGQWGIVLEDRVVIGRGAYVQSKAGSVHIGRDSVVGRGATIVSQGGVEIGEEVSIAGGCKISGGLFRIPADRDEPIEHYTKGPVRIGPRCILTMGAIVLDDVTIGEGTLVGAGAVVSSDVPPHSVVSPRPPLVLGPGTDESPVARGPTSEARASARVAARPEGAAGSSATVSAILAAVDEINLQLPPEDRLELSPETVLHGDHASLDSLRLVNLLVLVEERVEEAFGTPVSLGDAAMSADEGSNPFATVKSLARYIDDLRRS